ncbi:MAG: substrate-binding domain-containing protein [Coriobacteriia bacterium]|nr:substrate-binding domain-containing protein [Coriobacteriia bacterium]
MRQGMGTRFSTRVVAAFVFAIMVAALVAPAVAGAAVPAPTIALSTSLQATAKPVTISGSMGKAYRGKTVTVQVRKPGRAYWSSATSKDTTLSSLGRYSIRYTPKLAGKFYFRVRYNATPPKYSRTVSMTVKKGPSTKTEVFLSSTTSTRDSGLFEALKPMFLNDCPEYTIKAQFVGTGAAIALGGTGDADVLLTHSPSQEVAFMNGLVDGKASAYRGKSRYKVMYNDYVLVGPTANPAACETSETATSAFGKIAGTSSTFWSRNDKSGTNTKEKEIWALIDSPQIDAAASTTATTVFMPWYKASGTMGMAQALAASNDGASGGYTLSDRGTWLNAKALGLTKNLKIVNEGDANYFNQYSVIEVGGARNWEGAQDFSQWIRTPKAQEIIRTYGVSTYGQALFIPNQGSW